MNKEIMESGIYAKDDDGKIGFLNYWATKIGFQYVDLEMYQLKEYKDLEYYRVHSGIDIEEEYIEVK